RDDKIAAERGVVEVEAFANLLGPGVTWIGVGFGEGVAVAAEAADRRFGPRGSGFVERRRGVGAAAGNGAEKETHDHRSTGAGSGCSEPHEKPRAARRVTAWRPCRTPSF